MTPKQKAVFAVVLLLGLGTSVLGWRRAAVVQRQIEALRGEESTSQTVEQLERERVDAEAKTRQYATQLEDLQAARADLLKLRNEVSRLRNEARQMGQATAGVNAASSAATGQTVAEGTLKTLLSRVETLKRKLREAPAQQAPELSLLDEQDWIKAARNAPMDTEEDLLINLGRARTLAKEKLIPIMSQALQSYVEASRGQLPTDLEHLKPFLAQPMDDAIFGRYELVSTGDSRELKPGSPVIKEKERFTDYDTRWSLGLTGWGYSEPVIKPKALPQAGHLN